MRFEYDMLGTPINQASMDAGERWMLNDVVGNPLYRWDSRGHCLRNTYDRLRRPVKTFLTERGDSWKLVRRTTYGELLGEAYNHRGRIYEQSDQAGIVTFEVYDFKGNLRRKRRQVAMDYKNTLDWQKPVPEEQDFTTCTEYDALNRPQTTTSPDGSVYRPTFNEANLLNKVDVNLRGAKARGNNPIWTSFVSKIDYNAKGQRELIGYGNGAATIYEYDLLTFRLTHLKTTRPAALNGLASQIFCVPTVVQDLCYTYDPAGNITRIEDEAIAGLSSTGPADNGPCEYTYDAIYRLIEATGREHIGQTTHDLKPVNGNQRDYPFAGLAHPNDLQAMQRYTERYEYDAADNFQSMRHIANGGSWTRDYEYNAASLIEPDNKSNRLTRTTLGNAPEIYTYVDAQGNVHGGMTAINNMRMAWDFEDQLQQVDLGGGGKAFYVYDAAGQRVRKVIEAQNGTRKQERIYIDAFEIYREFKANGTDIGLERESLQVMDDKQRIALVETQTIENSSPVKAVPVQRYQLGNHLGSASVELDKDGALISYEEYHPYGTTAWQAGRSAAEVSLKRYRYTGKERDEESGLYYHGARYFASWLGRWTSCDPMGLVDGLNVYWYGRNNPLVIIDPTGTQGESPEKQKKSEPANTPPEKQKTQSNEKQKTDSNKKQKESARVYNLKETTINTGLQGGGAESAQAGITKGLKTVSDKVPDGPSQPKTQLVHDFAERQKGLVVKGKATDVEAMANIADYTSGLFSVSQDTKGYLDVLNEVLTGRYTSYSRSPESSAYVKFGQLGFKSDYRQEGRKNPQVRHFIGYLVAGYRDPTSGRLGYWGSMFDELRETLPVPIGSAQPLFGSAVPDVLLAWKGVQAGVLLNKGMPISQLGDWMRKELSQ
jgi:RHS repeat-associated protein